MWGASASERCAIELSPVASTRLWSTAKVHTELGKNATYAVIAFGLMHSDEQVNIPELWQKVRQTFTECVGTEPAKSEQGEIKLVTALFEGNGLVCISKKYLNNR
jgi:hypothetical protein